MISIFHYYHGYRRPGLDEVTLPVELSFCRFSICFNKFIYRAALSIKTSLFLLASFTPSLRLFNTVFDDDGYITIAGHLYIVISFTPHNTIALLHHYIASPRCPLLHELRAQLRASLRHTIGHVRSRYRRNFIFQRYDDALPITWYRDEVRRLISAPHGHLG